MVTARSSCSWSKTPTQASMWDALNLYRLLIAVVHEFRSLPLCTCTVMASFKPGEVHRLNRTSNTGRFRNVKWVDKTDC